MAAKRDTSVIQLPCRCAWNLPLFRPGEAEAADRLRVRPTGLP